MGIDHFIPDVRDFLPATLFTVENTNYHKMTALSIKDVRREKVVLAILIAVGVVGGGFVFSVEYSHPHHLFGRKFFPCEPIFL